MTRNIAKQLARAGALTAIAALVLAACGSSDSASKDDTTTKAKTTTTAASGSGGLDLDGTEFTATGVEGYTPVEGTNLTLTFDAGSLSVNAGCNTMTSAYEVTDGKLAWTGTPAATMMGCPDDLMNQDTWLNDFFTTGAEATLEDGTLTLTQDDVTITLEAVADAPLEGTAWTLQSTVANDAVSSLPAGVTPPTLTIATDGTATVFTGCNNGSTTVEVADTTLTFAPLAMTRMACEEDATTVENSVTTILDGEVLYSIEGTTLSIDNGGEGLIYTAEG